MVQNEVSFLYEHLRGLREDRDLSQTDMAQLLNVHQTTYSGYELGTLNIPVPILICLAEYFQTSIDFLLGLTDDPRPYPKPKRGAKDERCIR